MAKIINSNEELRLLIPNQLITIKGETPLFDKLAPFLDLAEAWVKETFIGGFRITSSRYADGVQRIVFRLDAV